MSEAAHTEEVAAGLRVSIGLLLRRLRQAQAEGELSLPESAALARLDRGGPKSASALAREEQISPQSMGATLAGLEMHGLIERRPDPTDGRLAILSLTEAGSRALRDRRDAHTRHLADAISTDFTQEEIDLLAQAVPLLERLAASI